MTSTTPIERRQLGSTGPVVFPIGLGCMGMSGMYGPASEQESIATIHAALDSGITLLDTGDFYGAGAQRAAHRAGDSGETRCGSSCSVKFGALRTPAGTWGGIDTRPVALRNFLTYTLDAFSASITSTSVGPHASTRACRLKRRLGAIADLVKAG